MKHKISVTTEQLYLISDIISRVQDIMTWDEDMEEYTDNDCFLLALSKEEYKTLMTIKF